nr:DNA alkylation repair protein [Vibrio mexicanus]
MVDELWALPEREYQLVGIDLLIKVKKKLPATLFEDVERWVTTKSWWDTVDFLASHIVGMLALNYPHEAEHYIQKWRGSENICFAAPPFCFN